MKNPLHTEIMKGLRKLGLSQQYNVLGLIHNLGGKTPVGNRLLAFPSVMKDQAMREINNALRLRPDQIDF